MHSLTADANSERLIRLPEVIQLTGSSRSSIYRDMADGVFPASIRIGKRSVAWRLSEILGWIRSRPTIA